MRTLQSRNDARPMANPLLVGQVASCVRPKCGPLQRSKRYSTYRTPNRTGGQCSSRRSKACERSASSATVASSSSRGAGEFWRRPGTTHRSIIHRPATLILSGPPTRLVHSCIVFYLEHSYSSKNNDVRDVQDFSVANRRSQVYFTVFGCSMRLVGRNKTSVSLIYLPSAGKARRIDFCSCDLLLALLCFATSKVTIESAGIMCMSWRGPAPTCRTQRRGGD